MQQEYIGLGMLALAGFLIGGVYSTWKTAKGMAIVLIVLTLIALGAGVAWLI